ncbi:MFS general substrate transporter [Basidiobolus meristosporus CBS 931.73]|uniref:MFS general substrate transporter n=1 Tax=Basidiobolus meristosporus CBS 931.73 TaxID=1314790 RepID=A0A1Y1ZAM5_9FUNG|nr:MFS general substrate transporter [Basidiobolus meristosporus CBS 931.73]|eukprot:ORY07363.1 MFS general substrate transporter [Basidiobolus meristosporus CBS 931.73]
MSISDAQNEAKPSLEMAVGSSPATNNSVATTNEVPRRWFFISIALSYLAFVVIGFNDGSFGVLLSGISVQYQVSDQMVAVVFLFTLIGYLLSSLVCGWLIERLTIRIYLACAGLLFIIATVLCGIAPPFAAYLAILVLLGVAVAAVDAGFNAYFVALPNNGALLNYLHASYGVGAWVGPIIANAVMGEKENRLRWHYLYYIWGGACLLVLLCFLAMFRNALPSMKSKDTDSCEKKNLANTIDSDEDIQGGLMMATLRKSVVWLGGLMAFVYMGAGVSIGSWTFKLFEESRGFSSSLSSLFVSIYWLGMFLGRVTLGLMARTRRRQFFVIYACLGFTILGLLLVWLLRSAAACGIGIFLIGYGLGPIYPTSIAVINDLLYSKRLQATAIGFITAFACCGNGLFSWLAGYLIGSYGYETFLPYEVGLVLGIAVIWIILHVRGLFLIKEREKSMAYTEDRRV